MLEYDTYSVFCDLGNGNQLALESRNMQQVDEFDVILLLIDDGTDNDVCDTGGSCSRLSTNAHI